MFLPILSAILGIIAFLPVNFYPLGFVWLAPLFIFFLKEKSFWRLVLGAVLFRLLFSLGTVYFTLEPILWVSSLLIFLGLPIAIFILKRGLARAFHSLFIAQYSLLFSLPFLWTFFDHLQARYSLAPIYIATAGNAFGSSPFVGLAGLGGLLFLTFFAALINALITGIVVNSGSGKNKINLAITAFIFILLFSGWQISNSELHKNSIAYNNLKNSIKIAVVSTNEKFNYGQLERLKKELSSQPVDFIIFPEDIFNDPPFGNLSTPIFQNLAKELNTNIVAAYDTLQGDKNKLKYNSAILFDNRGNVVGVHNKNRLTFVGEYWPFGNWRPPLTDWLKKRNPEIKNYAIFDPKNSDYRGERNLLTAAFQKNSALFASPICLEVHYPADLKEYKKSGAKFIVNPTSNRWVSIGLNHFLYLANNLKKIETVWLNLPIISSGVRDFAGIILPDNQTRLIDYQAGGKNYRVFIGEIKY